MCYLQKFVYMLNVMEYCLENVKSTSMEYGSSKYLVQKYFRVK